MAKCLNCENVWAVYPYSDSEKKLFCSIKCEKEYEEKN